jgi:3-dehydroquinate synthetase
LKTLECRPPGEPPTTLYIGKGLRHNLGDHVPELGTFLLADRVVMDLHPKLDNPEWPRILVSGGEHAKSFACLEEVVRAMAKADLDRSGRLIALGGGSIGDLGGLAASIFLRGIDLVQVPTTLLAMLDSSVGGKTAINLPEGKNLVGSFHPASRVLADMDFLTSLGDDEFRSGLGEALKVGIGLDRDLFLLLETEREKVLARDPEVLTEVVSLGVQAKIRLVEADPREDGPRRLLNLGHTLGHALEAHGKWTIPHGMAVARGMHFALSVALRGTLIDAGDQQRCVDLLNAYGFAATSLPPADELMPYLRRDKKRRGREVLMALPSAIGTAEQVPIKLEYLSELLRS